MTKLRKLTLRRGARWVREAAEGHFVNFQIASDFKTRDGSSRNYVLELAHILAVQVDLK